MTQREALQEWQTFLLAESHVLNRNPALLFQQAANRPDSTAPAYGAKARSEAGLETRPWLQYLNRPRLRSACLMTLAGHVNLASACAFSPDGHRIVSGSWYNTLKLRDAQTGAEVGILEGDMSWVKACAFSPDARRVVSGSGDCLSQGHDALKLWDAQTRLRIWEYELGGNGIAAAWSPGGEDLAAGDSTGRLLILRLRNFSFGPVLVTAWEYHSPRSLLLLPEKRSLHFGCPFCLMWSEVPASALGTVIPCPHCGESVNLNPFTIDADWRPIAAAWGTNEG
jgi:hypothetical protein